MNKGIRMEARTGQGFDVVEKVVGLAVDLFATVDDAGRLAWLSPGWERRLQRSGDELSGSRLVDLLVREEERDVVERGLDRIRSGAAPIEELVLGLRAGDDSCHWLVCALTPMPEHPGTVGLAARDLTGDRSELEALQQAADRWERVFSDAPIGMALISLRRPDTGRIAEINAAGARMLGYTPDELRGRLARDVNHPDDDDADRALTRQLLAGTIPRYVLERRYRHADGHVVWALLHASVIDDRAARPQYLIAQLKDISDRKAMQAELDRTRAQLEEIERAHAVGSWSWDMATGEVRWSDEVFRILGVERTDAPLTADDWFDRIHPDDRADVEAALAEVVSTGDPVDRRYRIVRPDGSTRLVRSTGRRIVPATGGLQVVGWVSVLDEPSSPAPPVSRAGRLTDRELHILRLIADGRSGPEIAAELRLSPETVKDALSRIYLKLGARERAAAVATALRAGLID